jgi:hypothetical protein
MSAAGYTMSASCSLTGLSISLVSANPMFYSYFLIHVLQISVERQTHFSKRFLCKFEFLYDADVHLPQMQINVFVPFVLYTPCAERLWQKYELKIS